MPKPIHEPPGVFHLYIHTDNAAFDPNAKLEIARILRETAERLEDGESFRTYRTLLDTNGNDVGRAKLNPREEE